MSIGKYTYGTNNLNIQYSDSGSKLIIGNFCSIAGNIKIYLGGNHRTDWVTTYPFGYINQHIFNNFTPLLCNEDIDNFINAAL
jgi:acetyltransferase-like isoleucine patch superfamily enzyme